MGKRSGSEKRKRNHQVNVRLTDVEWKKVQQLADMIGVSPAKFLRLAALEGRM